MHYHHCPKCYDSYECNLNCTIEPDLEADGKQFGSHCECFICTPIEGYDNKGNKVEVSSTQWFRKYNGFRDNSKKQQSNKNPHEPFSSNWWLWYNGFI